MACQKGLQNFKPGGGNATARLGNVFSYGSYGLLLGLSAAQSQAGTQGQEGNGAGDDIGADSGFVTGLGAGIGGRSLLEHEGDTAVAAVDILIPGHMAVFEALDIVGQDHIILHDIIQLINGTLEHGEAVAQVTEGVVIPGQLILLGQVQSLPGVGGAVEDLDILDPVFPGGAAGPNALFILLDGGSDIGMDLIFQAGDL